MIHYHGGPITPVSVAIDTWAGRHAFVSFSSTWQTGLAAQVCQSFALDNGAYTAWMQGKGVIDVEAYVQWVQQWERHPGFDFAVIPDQIDGTEADNNILICRYRDAGGNLARSVPVWHMHESLDRLNYFSHAYPRVALGSSGQYAKVGSPDWWARMAEAMQVVCDDEGRPRCKLHGLRMLSPEIFRRLPLASADSTNLAQSHSRDSKRYKVTKKVSALILASRIEAVNGAERWVAEEEEQVSLDIR